MMTLQAQIAEDVVRNTFNTSPDTVFGILISILVLVILGLSYAMWKLIKDHKEEMKGILEKYNASEEAKYKDMRELSLKTIETMTTVVNKIEELIRK